MKKMISRRNFLKVAGASTAALGLAACGGSSSSTASSTASSAAGSSTAAKADGKVYYLNFKPEQDQAWQDLAAAYTKETGVPVTVVTAASGQYETTLMSEMEKSEAPTLFQVNGPVGLANWKDYCYDLSGSKLYGELTSDSFALKDGDAVTSIAYVIETYGIIYNKELLTADLLRVQGRRHQLHRRYQGHLPRQLQADLGSVHHRFHLRSHAAGFQDRQRCRGRVCW